MATLMLEDLTGTVEVVVWPKSFTKYSDLLENSDTPILVRGRVEVDGKGESRLLCSEICPLDSVWKNGVQKAKISIPVPAIESATVDRLKDLLSRYPGQCPVEFELHKSRAFSIRVIPNENLEINPIPAFIQEVERLFGENTVTLYT